MSRRSSFQQHKAALAQKREYSDANDLFDPHTYTDWKHEPLDFVLNVLGLADSEKGIDPFQQYALKTAGDPDQTHMALQAAHGCGKTTLLGWLLLWWLLTRPFSRVQVVAPAFERQASRYLFPEVQKWCRKSDYIIPVEVRKKSIEVSGWEDEWFALAIQGTQAGKVEGGHNRSMMILADEAKALDADVINALHGTQTDTSGDRMYVMASVPGSPSGPFYEACKKSDLWKTHQRSATASTLVGEEWIRERQKEWGGASPIYKARVLGQFPDEDEGTMFPLSMVEDAAKIPAGDVATEEDRISIGVDPARYGPDRSAMAVWEGTALKDIDSWQGLNSMQVASRVHNKACKIGADLVIVDKIGIGGGVVDRLEQLEEDSSHNYEILEEHVGKPANEKELYYDRRAEIFRAMRDEMERDNLSLIDDDELETELTSLRFHFSARGKIQMEKKDQTKKRVGHSPDLADAVGIGCPISLPPDAQRNSGKLVHSRPLGAGGI